MRKDNEMIELGIQSAAYIVATILFILALGGLKDEESAKRAIWYGIVGMTLAVVATVFGPGVQNILLILLAVAAGSFAGWYVAGPRADDRDAATGGGLAQLRRSGGGLHRAECRHHAGRGHGRCASRGLAWRRPT